MCLPHMKKQESFKGGDNMRTVSSRMSRNAIEHPSLSPVREEGSSPDYPVNLLLSLLHCCNNVNCAVQNFLTFFYTSFVRFSY